MPTVSTLHLGGTFAETHVYNTVYMYICLYTLRLLCYLHSHSIDGPITDDKHNDLPFETCHFLVSSFHRGGRHGDHLRFPGSRCQRISRKNLTARPVAMEVHPLSIR